jgi:hypothetical protein
VDPAFHLDADPFQDPGGKAEQDPDPGQSLKSQKGEFLNEKNRSNNIPMK